MMKPWLLAAAFSLAWLPSGNDARAADGCGAGLYRDIYGRCHFYQAGTRAPRACAVGYIWRNGRCRQNIENDPFVSTWPNAPR